MAEYMPNQSNSLSRVMRDEYGRLLSGVAGLVTSSVAEPIAGLNALAHADPSLVDTTRQRLTVGNAANLIPNNLTMPEWVKTGIGYFNESADRLGAISPVAGAALKAAPAFVSAFAAPQSRAAFANVTDDIGRYAAQNSGRQVPRAVQQGGYIAYHGTPHNVDKFDSSKIGTGEGAQVYGHGLYFADNPDVARQYQKTLGTSIAVDGKRMYEGGKYKGTGLGTTEDSILLSTSGDIDKAIELANFEITDPYTLKKVIKNLEGVRGKIKTESTGNLYKVDIPDEHLESMIDWDAPLSKQPQKVQQALNSMHKELRDKFSGKTNIGEELKGSNIYGVVQDYYAGGRKNDAFTNSAAYGAKDASAELRDAGIKGIRYLDGDSRVAGQGTRNTVLFDDSLVSIMGRE